jgi:3-isopropylmalate/(R)-2-methylmalate dehydratase small subunit
MIIKGKVHKFGGDVNTDEIIPAKYLNTTDHKELASHVMSGIDEEFPKKVKQGDIIVAGKNFGCGSSREHAPIAIKAAGIQCVIAESFARIFLRNSINIGLPIFEKTDISKEIGEGDTVEIDTATGIIKNLTKDESYQSKPFPKFLEEIIESGGLLKWIKKFE